MDASYLSGRTTLRDVLTARFGCSQFEAEGLVETLELQGFIRFPRLLDDTHPIGDLGWQIG